MHFKAEYGKKFKIRLRNIIFIANIIFDHFDSISLFRCLSRAATPSKTKVGKLAGLNTKMLPPHANGP